MKLVTSSRIALALVAASPFALVFACTKTSVDLTPPAVTAQPSAVPIDTAPSATDSSPAPAPPDTMLAPLNSAPPQRLPPGTHAVRTKDGGVAVVNDAGAPVAMPPGFSIPSSWPILPLPSGFPTAFPSNIVISPQRYRAASRSRRSPARRQRISRSSSRITSSCS